MNLRRAFGLAACLWIGGLGPAVAEPSGIVRANLQYSDEMFDRQDHVTNKVVRQLRARQSGSLPEGTLTFGGRLIASQIYETTNTPGRFPILSRLPPTHTRGSSDSYGVINDVSLNATLTLPMTTAFAQAEYTEVEYPGQDAVQLRKYWLVFGDLDLAPFYVAIGRKTVNFGNFATYAPFTHSHSSHYFWPQSDDPVIEIGYVTDRTEIAVSLIPEHRGLRVLSSPNNDGDLENYAINARHRLDMAGGRSLQFGAGFLRGTIYDSVIAHHPPGVGINRTWNGAWDANLTYSGPGFDLQAEFTRTLNDWPATGHHVQATTVQARWHRDVLGKPATWSISASRGVQGPDGSNWERMEQVILGLEVEAARHVRLGAEYMYNAGFVPLILPTITSDRTVESHSVIAGIKLTF